MWTLTTVSGFQRHVLHLWLAAAHAVPHLPKPGCKNREVLGGLYKSVAHPRQRTLTLDGVGGLLATTERLTFAVRRLHVTGNDTVFLEAEDKQVYGYPVAELCICLGTPQEKERADEVGTQPAPEA